MSRCFPQAAATKLPSTAPTLSDTWLGVNALRLTAQAHVVHELKSLFPDECEDISRGKTGAKGHEMARKWGISVVSRVVNWLPSLGRRAYA